MSCFLLHHRHEPRECAVVFAAWSGFRSPLRRRPAVGACHYHDHQIWWVVQARSEREALDLLPCYLAVRTKATLVREVAIP
jgi:hypothetical protein